MGKLLKIFGIILIVFTLISLSFVIEESYRLKKNDNALPLITIGKTNNCIKCLKDGEELLVEYKGIGYKVNIRYFKLDNKVVVTEKEFLLFNMYRLWAWIS